MYDLSRMSTETKLQVLSNVTNTLIGSMTVDGQVKEGQLMGDCVTEVEKEGKVDPLLHPILIAVLLANVVIDIDPKFNFAEFVARKNKEMGL